VGELIPIDAEDSQNGGHGHRKAPGDVGCPGDTQAPAGAVADVKIDSGLLIPRAFRDHNPVLYSVHLWNALVESREDLKMTPNAKKPTD
jgi:hypothetical protein